MKNIFIPNKVCPVIGTVFAVAFEIRYAIQGPSFRRSCERAGIKGITPHTLHHTAGTLMALAGIDLFLIAKVLGHSVQKTTELYAHFQPEYLRGTVNALEAAIPKQINVPYT